VQLRERGGVRYGALEQGGGGLAASNTCDRRRRAAVGVTRDQGRRESGMWATPGERGPAGEEGK
jgi:hypothetical protein